MRDKSMCWVFTNVLDFFASMYKYEMDWTIINWVTTQFP